MVAANGGSDLIYLPDGDKDLAKRVIEVLLAQDYVSGIFVDSKLGRFPGTLTLRRHRARRHRGDAAPRDRH